MFRRVLTVIIAMNAGGLRFDVHVIHGFQLGTQGSSSRSSASEHAQISGLTAPILEPKRVTRIVDLGHESLPRHPFENARTPLRSDRAKLHEVVRSLHFSPIYQTSGHLDNRMRKFEKLVPISTESRYPMTKSPDPYSNGARVKA